MLRGKQVRGSLSLQVFSLRSSRIIAIALIIFSGLSCARASATVGTKQSLLPEVAAVQGQVALSLAVRHLPPNLSPQLSGEENAIFTGNPCLDQPGYRTAPNGCAFGNLHAKVTLDLVGDSFAEMWIPTFHALGLKYNFRVIAFARYGCVNASLVIINWLRTVDPGCAPWRQNVIHEIQVQSPPPSMIAFAQFHPAFFIRPTTADGRALTAAQWNAGLATTFDQFRKMSAIKVLVVGTPWAQSDPSVCLSTHLTSVQACTTPVGAAYIAGQDAADAGVARAHGVQPIDVTKLFCSKGQCPDVVAGRLTHANQIHVHTSYAAYLAPAMGQLLGCAGLVSLSAPQNLLAEKLLASLQGVATRSACEASGVA